MKINLKQSVCAFTTLFTLLATGSLSAKDKTAGEKLDQGIEKTEKAVEAVKDKAKEVASDVEDKAKEAADKAKEVAHDAKENVKEKAHDVIDKT